MTCLQASQLSPASSLKLLVIVVLLWSNWEILTPLVAKGIPNPFAPLLFISHRVPASSPEDPRYQKGYLDLVFIAFYVVFWSFIRQSITLWFLRPLAKWFGIRRELKLDRFGEQGYAVAYFAFTGLWGWVSTFRRGVQVTDLTNYCVPTEDNVSASHLVVSNRVFLDR